MPVFEHEKDRPDAMEARAAQEDPSVMYLVVRKSHGASLEELLVASAEATLRALAEWGPHPRYAAEFAHWSFHSFRKVCLRASEKDFARVAELDGGEGRVRGEAVVRALPPRRKSARERLLVQLQAYTAEASELPSRGVEVGGDGLVMVFVLNGSVPMRAGKLAAQIGHAVLLAVGVFARSDADRDALTRWLETGTLAVVRRADAETWEALKREERCALVRDAGLTEVAQGSETFLALCPRERSKWSERVAALSPL